MGKGFQLALKKFWQSDDSGGKRFFSNTVYVEDRELLTSIENIVDQNSPKSQPTYSRQEAEVQDLG